MRLLIMTNTAKSKVTKDNGVYKIEGIPVTVDDSVMNNTHYDEYQNKKGMRSFIGMPMTLTHPEDEEGYNVSALSPNGIDYYAGGKITDVYNKDGVWYFDSEIKEKKMRSNEENMGDYFADRLDAGLPIGVSTGLLYEKNDISGENAKGEKYSSKAINIQGDHLAMLHESEQPAGGDATVMRFNGEDVDVVNFDDFEPVVTNDKKGLYAWLESKIDTLITKRYNKQDENINVNENEVPEMELKELQEALQANNEQLLKTFNEQLDAKVSALDSKIDAVNTAVTANADKEKADLVAKVNKLELGLPESAVNAMNTDELNSLLAKHEGKPAGGVSTNSRNKPVESDHGVDLNALITGDK